MCGMKNYLLRNSNLCEQNKRQVKPQFVKDLFANEFDEHTIPDFKCDGSIQYEFICKNDYYKDV